MTFSLRSVTNYIAASAGTFSTAVVVFGAGRWRSTPSGSLLLPGTRMASPQTRYPTSIRLSVSLKQRLVAQARRSGHECAALIVWVLEQWVAHQEARQKPGKKKN